MNTPKLVSLQCQPGQSVYQAIDEAIKDGDLPADARLGDYQRRGMGGSWHPEPEGCLGTVQVRPYESFYIVHRPSATE